MTMKVGGLLSAESTADKDKAAALPPPATASSKPATCLDAWSPGANLRGLWQRPEGALDCLDGLRAFAVVWVVLYHCFVVWGGLFGPPFGPQPWLQLYTNFTTQLALSGDLGVDVFFVLSGFLIALQAVRELKKTGRLNFRAFLWARWWRIAPTYYAALLFLALTNLSGDRATCAQSWWMNVLFINNLQGHGFGGVLDWPDCCLWTWSIGIEFQFYLLTPLLLLLVCRSDGQPRAHCFKALLALFLVFQSILVALYFSLRTGRGEPPAMTNVLWTRAHTYIAGIAACLAYSSGFKANGRGWLLVDTLAGLVFCTIACLGNGQDLHRPIASASPGFNVVLILFSQGLMAACVAWAAFRMCSGTGCGYLSRILCLHIWAPVARLSYSAYLLQFAVITPIVDQWKLFPDGIGVTNSFFRFTGFSAVILVLVFALALVHYLLFEGPSLRLRHRVTPKCLARA